MFETTASVHAVAMVLHLLLFTYWFGGDVGVFYSSGFVADRRLTREARLTAAKIMLNLDLIPRICMSLMLTVGGILTQANGVQHAPWQMAAILLLGPVWLAMVLFIHFREGSTGAHAVQRVDFWFRWFVIAAVIASVTHSLATGRLAGHFWIAAKLLIFAGLVFCGLMIRLGMPPFIAAFRELAAGRATPESDARMQRNLARLRPWVLMIWAGLLAEVVLGVTKPG